LEKELFVKYKKAATTIRDYVFVITAVLFLHYKKSNFPIKRKRHTENLYAFALLYKKIYGT